MIVRRHLWALILTGLSPLQAQTADSTASAPGLPPLDRYLIDVAALVRESGARSLADVLISQVPGLLVIPGSGLNGGAARIRFAGPRTLVDDAAPLVLVDGIRVDQSEDAYSARLLGAGPLRLEDFNVEDIETIEVLSGVAGAAAYGPGASNGVILIRTKRGRSGPVRWEAHAAGGLAVEPSRWPTNYGGVDAANPDSVLRSGGCTLVTVVTRSCVQDYVESFNPLVQRNPFVTAFRRQVGVGASGGPSWGGFRMAANVEGADGVYAIPGAADPNSYRRWTVGGSGTARMLPRLEVSAVLGYTSSHLGVPAATPTLAEFGPSDSTGFAWSPTLGSRGSQSIGRATGALEVRWSPASWLTAEGRGGIDDLDQHDAGSGLGLGPTVIRYEADHQTRQQTWAAQISGSRSIGAGVRVTATVGLERLDHRLDHESRAGPDSTPFCTTTCSATTLTSEQRSLGYYVESVVALRERLFVTAALRHDRFDEFHLGATRAGIGASWAARVGHPGLLGSLRFHAGYGSAGQAPNASLETFVIVGSSTPFIGPERTRSFEVGMDAGSPGGRWTAHWSYHDIGSDAVVAAPVSASTGFVTVYVPGAEITNRAVEAILGGRLLDGRRLGWDLRVSVWGNRNRLGRLPVPPFFVGDGLSFPTLQFVVPGYPVGGYWPIPIAGFADTNGDGIIMFNEVVSGAAQWAGTPYPTQGAMLASAWRVAGRFRVEATLDYRAGQMLFNATAWRRCTALYAVCRDANFRTTPLAVQATATGAAFGPVPPRYFEDADYLKLRELSVSLEVPAETARMLGARTATISLAGRNLATWSRYSGPDPESGSYGRLVSGMPAAIADYATLPPPRVWSLRVQLGY
jgi:TonB-dependent starch-binding outer membrane protein SusC